MRNVSSLFSAGLVHSCISAYDLEPESHAPTSTYISTPRRRPTISNHRSLLDEAAKSVDRNIIKDSRKNKALPRSTLTEVYRSSVESKYCRPKPSFALDHLLFFRPRASPFQSPKTTFCSFAQRASLFLVIYCTRFTYRSTTHLRQA